MASLRVLEFIRHADPVWNLPRPLVDDLRRRFPRITIDSPRDQAEADHLLPEADIVLGWAVKPGNFALARKLQWIQVTAAGVGGLLFPALVESPVTVTNGRGLWSEAMAEHTIGVIATGYEIFTISPTGLHRPPYDLSLLGENPRP